MRHAPGLRVMLAVLALILAVVLWPAPGYAASCTYTVRSGDTLGGIHCVLGVLLACIQRARDPERRGQVIDAALYESVFNLMEGVVPEYSGAGVVREPSGSTLTGIVPTNTYKCQDGKFVIIGGNGDSIYKRLMQAIGRTDLGDDPRMADNACRVAHEKELDAAITAWTTLGSRVSTTVSSATTHLPTS